jgi:hypothetical protein
MEVTPAPSPNPAFGGDAELSETEEGTPHHAPPAYSEVMQDDKSGSSKGKRKTRSRRDSKASGFSNVSADLDGTRDDEHPALVHTRERDWGVGDDAGMGLS